MGTIFKGYIIEPLREKPYFSFDSKKQHSDDRVHKFKIRIENNGNKLDHGAFMISGIPCRIISSQLVVPDVSSNESTWWYNTSEPIREIGQIFISTEGGFLPDNWLDASSTTQVLWEKYEERQKREISYVSPYLLIYLKKGISYTEFNDQLAKFGSGRVAASEFSSWFKFLCQNNYDKDFCRQVLKNASPLEFQQAFHFLPRKYGIAKKAVQFYIDKTR